MDDYKVCAKCNGSMNLGHIPDAKSSIHTIASWVEGLPEQSIFGNVKVNVDEQKPIVSYCCKSCGYLESYAVLD